MGRDPVNEYPRDTDPDKNNSWKVENTNFQIPLGKWMTQEIYVKEGGSAGNTKGEGRFYMAITVDGVKTVIFDKVGVTASEEPGAVWDGQTSWMPMKLYTEGKVADWFKAANKPMDMYWDDLEIWLNRTPETKVN
jgi:hypothetical protein